VTRKVQLFSAEEDQRPPLLLKTDIDITEAVRYLEQPPANPENFKEISTTTPVK